MYGCQCPRGVQQATAHTQAFAMRLHIQGGQLYGDRWRVGADYAGLNPGQVPPLDAPATAEAILRAVKAVRL